MGAPGARGTQFPQVASLALRLGAQELKMGTGKRRGELTSSETADANHGPGARP